MTKAAPNVATRPAAQVGDIIGGGGAKHKQHFFLLPLPSSVCVRNKCGGGEREKKIETPPPCEFSEQKDRGRPKSMPEQLTCTVSPFLA